jgi:hemolysin activation/secretion protein
MTFIFIILLAANAFAQAPPNAGSLLQEQQGNQPRVSQPLPFEEAPGKESTLPQEGGINFVVQGFRFTGLNGLVSEDELNALLKDAIGKEVGLAGLKQLAGRITKHLHKKGWFLASADIPRQEIKDGIVDIVITVGTLEKGAVIRGRDLRISEPRLEKTATSAAPDDSPASMQDIERGVLLLNDLPGIQAKSNVERGDAPGTARLAVNASEGPFLSGQVVGDNYGNRYTGNYRGTAILQANDPFRYGDQLSLSVTENTNYQFEQAGYTLPIGYSGLRAGLSYSEMRYEIDKELIALGLDGGSRVVGTTLNYPIVRSRTTNLWTGVEYDWKNLWDRASGAFTDNKFVNVGTVHVNGDKLDTLLGGGYSTMNIGLAGGALDRSADQEDLTADEETAKSAGTYGKFTYGGSRLQRLYFDRLNLFVSVNGQVAFDNLDSSEKFILGGPYGVRAYPVGEAAGDTGGIFTSEIRYDFPQLWVLGIPELVGFYDLGWTELHVSPWANSGTAYGNKNAYALSGAGFGLNLTKPGVYSIRAAWAVKIGDNPGRSLAGLDSDGKDDTNRCWLQAMIMF